MSPSHQRRELNVIELSFLLVCIGIGWALGALGHRYFGVAGFIVGFVGGCLLLPTAIHLRVKLKRPKSPWW
jgi:hypothetical protein